MLIYMLNVIIVAVGILVFYLTASNCKKSEVRVAEYGLPNKDREGYIEAAERCKKNNSPVSNKPFHKLYLDGATMVNDEKFVLSDWEKKDGGRRVV